MAVLLPLVPTILKCFVSSVKRDEPPGSARPRELLRQYGLIQVCNEAASHCCSGNRCAHRVRTGAPDCGFIGLRDAV